MVKCVGIISLNESTGQPTQKPFALYEKFIGASSDKGDLVLNPYCGCTSTWVVPEWLERQWVGMDIWDGSKGVLFKRLEKEDMIIDGSMEIGGQQPLFPKDITFTTELPERTDEKQAAVPFLRAKERVTEPEGPKWTRTKMYGHLIDRKGCECQ